MSRLRAFELQDIFLLHRCNLDFFTETFPVSYYLDYFCKWPELCKVVDGPSGELEAYILAKVEDKMALPWHGHITALSVALSARRLGAGFTLSNAVERLCDKQKGWFMDLFVRLDNVSAQALYRNMGYSVYRRVVKYYSDNVDAFDMRKPLSRDANRVHIRENGEEFRVDAWDVL